MAKILKGSRDPYVDRVAAALDEYESQHAGAEASVYRQNPGAIRVRIIDDRFAGTSRTRRHTEVWDFLSQRLDEDVLGEIYTLTLLPTSELRSSMANMDFEDPLPSGL